MEAPFLKEGSSGAGWVFSNFFRVVTSGLDQTDGGWAGLGAKSGQCFGGMGPFHGIGILEIGDALDKIGGHGLL